MGQSTRKNFFDFARTPTEKAHLETSRSSKTFYLEDGRFKLWTWNIAYARAYNNKLYPVAYASKKLFSAECKYSTLERECLAIEWEMTKFRLYLAGKPFILQTDHKPLSYLNQAKFQNNRIMRWALALQGYNYKVESIPGKDNVVADYLSRIIG